MSSKLLVFIGLLQQVFVVYKQIDFFSWACVSRFWLLDAHTSCWKIILFSYHVKHSSRKLLLFVSKQVCTIKPFFWWWLTTFKTWSSFILYRIWQILGELQNKSQTQSIKWNLKYHHLMLYRSDRDFSFLLLVTSYPNSWSMFWYLLRHNF